MRILHTSDWHLGRILYGVHLINDQAHVLEQFIQLVAYSKPDVILITGDIYDRSVPPTGAVTLLDDVLGKILLDYEVPVILIAGNHDSPDRLGFGAGLLARQDLHLICQLNSDLGPVVIHDSAGPVYFCPAPYAEPPLVRERLRAPDAASHEQAMLAVIQHLTASTIPAGARRVILAHAFVAGGEESESERPLSVGGSGAVSASLFQPFHYAALGHLHQPQRVGDEHVRYAGSLLKYSFSEALHQKSVTLVEMDGAGKTKIETIPLIPRRDVRCLEGYFADIRDNPQKEGRDDYIMVTLLDKGPVMDAIGRLREVYPNVLHIERPALTTGGELRGPGGDHRRMDEAALFTSFFEQVTGEPLSEEQNKVFAELLGKFFRQAREVQA